MVIDINSIFILTVPMIMGILYLISQKLLIVSVIGSFFSLMITLYVVRNSDRKEILNIIQSGKILYFNLSDDQLFSVELEYDEQLRELLLEVLRREEETIKEMVYYINFVNFKNDLLEKELNDLINHSY